MRSALLHIGPHKTGTSYLQACFSHNRAALAERGVIVPAGWDHAPGNTSHTGLVRALGNGGDMAGAAAIIERSYADGNTLLVSAEDLSSMPVAALQRLRQLLQGVHVTVIFYVRRWSDLLPSGWQELVKQGHTLSFPEYFAATVRNPETSPIFSLDLRLGNFIEVFGQSSIKLVCYSILRDARTDLFSHFASQFLGWHDAPPPFEMPEMNVSRTPEEIDLLRRLNMIEFARTRQKSSALRNRLDAAWESLDTQTIIGAMEASKRMMMFNDAAPNLRRMHEEMHQHYRMNIVPPALPKFFFRSAQMEIPFMAADYLLVPGIVEALQRIHDTLTMQRA